MRRATWSTTVLAMVIAASLFAVSPAGAVGGFGDVGADAYYTEAVQWMADHGVTDGTSPGCFSPENATSRAQVATFLHRTHGSPEGGSEPFADVDGDDYFRSAVAWMVGQGITTGTTPTTYSPDQLVTRGQLATFLYRAAGAPDTALSAFADVAPDAFYADAVAWMVDEGITTGTTPTTFEPHRHVTRAEVATFLHRAAGAPPVTVQRTGDCRFSAAAAELTAAEAHSFRLLNELRVGLGLDPLLRDGSMDRFARVWSETMDRTGDFEHSGGPWSENIAWSSVGHASPADAAQWLHDLWVDSPAHHRNMTGASHDSVGIGFWRSESGGWHATHVFRAD